MTGSIRRSLGALAIGIAVTACAGPATDAPSSSSVPPPPATSGTAAPTPPPSVSAAPATPAAEASAVASTPVDDPLLAMELRDVRTGEVFTLGDLAADGPVIVETMAIWCTNCRQQMHEVTAAHEIADFHSVSVDVEPAEVEEDLVAYAAREGFDWPFVLADAELASLLRDRFGTEVLFPPGMPKLLIGSDGSVELLPLGDLLSAEEIAALVEA